MYYVPQVTRHDCGYACLKMLLAAVHKDERYLYLKEDEKHGPYSYLELISIAQRYEVTLIGVKYDDKDDLSHQKSFPLILSLKRENGGLHAVLLVKRKGKKVKVLDPDKGVYYQKISSLIKEWDGTVLAVNQVKEKHFNARIIDLKDTKGEIISYVIQSIAAIFIALATFFIKPDGFYLLPIIFCSLSLISEIILRLFLLKRLQKSDRYLRLFLRYTNKKDYFEFYKRSQEYKKSALTMGLNYVFYLLVIIMIITISLFNSLTFVVSVIVSLLASLIEVFFFAPFKKNIRRGLEQQENELRSVKEAEDMEMKVKNIEVNSYRYAYLEFVNKIVVVSFFVIASFFISAIEHTFTLLNVSFYTCVSYLLYQYLVPLFSFDGRLKDIVVAKVKINNLIHQNDEK